VAPILRCFTEHSGDYPFPEDGYKFIETPDSGMEHQSAVTHGNRFQAQGGRRRRVVGALE